MMFSGRLHIPKYNRMAPPLHCATVISVLCGIIAALLLLFSISTTTWLVNTTERRGLWEKCIVYSMESVECAKNEAAPWRSACAAMCIMSLLICLLATFAAVIGLNTKNCKLKYRMYSVARGVMLLAIICGCIGLITFPIKFRSELPEDDDVPWEFGWAYGVGWGAVIFMTGACILLLLDKESEEITYHEKTVYNEDDYETEATT
ncbi:transmembrane protein 47-like isoform X1 [Octopus sinensis]|uniref:Transmembrane protein 47-like isoform X1 n=1 Tax=Octopus sinensis TaxID=2607531 RepID=A0A7E6F715_9MOLL|nr:transmembrane protein 47-like isoform X1 [Octopus sinensis]